MTDPTPIQTPSGYAPAEAVGYADADTNLVLVSEQQPLPVWPTAPAAPAPLMGTAAQSELAGPYVPVTERPIVVTLGGVWSGTVRLLRSTDGGATLASLRVGGVAWGEYVAPGCEQAWTESENGASFYLDIALASGSVDYRVSQ